MKQVRRGGFKVRFRASSNDELLGALAREHRLDDFVELLLRRQR